MAKDTDKLFDGILLLSDLDGTLLDTKKNIPERNLKAIQRFMDLGGRFTIATGRCPRSAKKIADMAGTNCPGVTLNGAVLYDFDRDAMSGETCLPDTYKDMVRYVHQTLPHIGVQVYVGSDIYVAVTSEVVERLFVIEHLPRVKTTLDCLPDRASKVLFGASNEQLQEVRRLLEKYSMNGMYGMFTEDFYYEVLPLHTNKGTGAAKVAEICGIEPQCVAAVGDYYNDVDMLKSVAYPIVAGNAPDDVKIFARHITRDCDTGVVADAIEHLERRLLDKGHI